MYYVTTQRSPHVLALRSSPRFSSDRYVGTPRFLPGPQNLPLFKPPWGSLTAIDLRFEQHCEGNSPALHGKIHWAS